MRLPIEGQTGLGSNSLLDGDPVAYHARVRPRAIACVDAASGERFTYAHLNRRVAQAAGLLHARLGDPVGRPVAFLGRNSIDQVVLFMACQRAGAIFQPLNWRLTGAELAVLLSDAAPGLLVVDDEFGAQADVAVAASGVSPDRVSSEAFGREIDGAAPAEPITLGQDAPCTLLYTSGTTGKPKGVIITRSGAFHAALNLAFVGEVSADSVLLTDAPMFHTVGLFAVTRSTLTLGATLVVSDRFIPAQTLARLSDPALGVTHYFGVPQIASAMLNAPEYAKADLSRLKAFFTGGAPLPPPLVDAFMRDGVTLVNGYGASETGTALHMPLDPEATRAHSGSVGFPAPAVSVRIVDQDGQDAPDGQDGELWIKGPAVTPGYWRNPAATQLAFVDGWFKTGDAARREPNGMYRLIDRWKDMYISGGENVYPAEVEAALLAHPHVQDAAVVGAPHARWGECGVAFVVLQPGAPPVEAALIAHCDGRLARYKWPSEIRFVAEVPRNASGKIRKDHLRRLLADLVGA
jgi:fatty-acyl-CoA synthase